MEAILRATSARELVETTLQSNDTALVSRIVTLWGSVVRKPQSTRDLSPNKDHLVSVKGAGRSAKPQPLRVPVWA